MMTVFIILDNNIVQAEAVSIEEDKVLVVEGPNWTLSLTKPNWFYTLEAAHKEILSRLEQEKLILLHRLDFLDKTILKAKTLNLPVDSWIGDDDEDPSDPFSPPNLH